MTVTFPLEVEQKLVAAAAQKGLAPDAYLLALLQKDWGGQTAVAPSNGARGDDFDPEVLSRAIARMKSRTPAERAAMRERVMLGTPEPLPLPAGKTLFDMLPRLRGNETEAEVYEALERLS